MDNFSQKVSLNNFGFYQVKEMPDKTKLKDYYEKKYYQDEVHYQHNYSNDEKNYILNKIIQKANIRTADFFTTEPG